MPLRLSPEDQEEYNERYTKLAAQRDYHIARGNPVSAKSYRQCISALYNEFKRKELPIEPLPQSFYNELLHYESNLTIEERIERIERHLKIGFYVELPNNP